MVVAYGLDTEGRRARTRLTAYVDGMSEKSDWAQIDSAYHRLVKPFLIAHRRMIKRGEELVGRYPNDRDLTVEELVERKDTLHADPLWCRLKANADRAESVFMKRYGEATKRILNGRPWPTRR
jgi:hypothetical protein